MREEDVIVTVDLIEFLGLCVTLYIVYKIFWRKE